MRVRACVLLSPVWSLWYHLLSCTNPAPPPPSLPSSSMLCQNIHVVQRAMFWLQYALTMPAIVLLHDTVLQQRVEEYLLVRLLLSISITMLAAGYDLLCMFNENVAKDGGLTVKGDDVKRNDNMRDATFMCWGLWVFAVLTLMYTSPPMALSWVDEALIPGASSGIQAAFALYVMGMPIACFPSAVSVYNDLSIDNLKPRGGLVSDAAESTDSDTLGVRLVVEFAARLLLTLTVYFWLSEPAVPLPIM